jgi:NAD(P)-dependent dehydrogenase (short-subunit alcohol dehydrogenase family)
MSEPMLPLNTLKDRVAVITGGGTGIGLGIASVLAELGATVVLASRNPEHLAQAEATLAGAGRQAVGIATDVRQAESVDALFDQVLANFGTVDILVNAAAGNFIVDTQNLSVNGWNSVVQSVLNGSFYCARRASLAMIASGRGGKILSVVASYAWTGGPRTVHSVAAKAGVIALTKSLAVEWAPHHIRVNAICPGPTDTEGARPLWQDPQDRARILAKIPVGRFGTVDEVAQAASYLVSPYADFINGEVLVIDGGEWLGKGLTS